MTIKIRCFLLSCLLFSLLGESPAQNAHTRLQSRIDSGDFFRFRREFQRDSSGLSIRDRYYFSAYNAYLFNRSQQSNEFIAKCLAYEVRGLKDTLAVSALMIGIENDMRLGDYAGCLSRCRMLLGKYDTQLDAEEKEAVRNVQRLCEPLEKEKPLTVELAGGMKIKGKHDMAGLIRFEVKHGNKDSRFIFDTGANLSTISHSEAVRLGIRLLGSEVAVASSSKKAVGAQMGIADSLLIGKAMFRNVVFLVMPDDQLRFLGGLYKIKGIIGLPVIAALHEIQLTSDAELIVPDQATDSPLRNFGLHGFSPFAEMTVYGDSLTYLFDTGAATSMFGKGFYQKNKNTVDASGKKKTARVGGAGGVVTQEIIAMPHLPYSLGGRSGKLAKATVLPAGGQGSAIEGWHSGIIGQDILRQHERVILNFDRMFLILQ